MNGLPPETGHRVLVVEDDPQTAEDLRLLLQSRGDRPRIATTVEEALRALAEETFCYIVPDQQLPTSAGGTPMLGGGECILRTVRVNDGRRQGAFHVTPIVVLTSYSGHEDFVSKMYDLGASAFMSKPLRGNFERFLDKVSVALERAKRGTHADCAAHAPEVEAAAGPERATMGRIAEQIGAKTFADLAIKIIDGHTARVVCQRKYVHATDVDLRVASRGGRTPTQQWDLLLKICAGHGTFRWKNYGSINTAKQRVFVLRSALRGSLGLEDDPFHKFRVVDGWRARFFASSELAKDDG